MRTLTIRLLLFVGLACGYVYAAAPTCDRGHDVGGSVRLDADCAVHEFDRALRFDTLSEALRKECGDAPVVVPALVPAPIATDDHLMLAPLPPPIEVCRARLEMPAQPPLYLVNSVFLI
jgi:hypothetical protein